MLLHRKLGLAVLTKLVLTKKSVLRQPLAKGCSRVNILAKNSYSFPTLLLISPCFLVQNNRKGLFLPCFTQNAYLSPHEGRSLPKYFSLCKLRKFSFLQFQLYGWRFPLFSPHQYTNTNTHTCPFISYYSQRK